MTLLKSAFLARFQLSEKHRREELGFCSGALYQREGSWADVPPQMFLLGANATSPPASPCQG